MQHKQQPCDVWFLSCLLAICGTPHNPMATYALQDGIATLVAMELRSILLALLSLLHLSAASRTVRRTKSQLIVDENSSTAAGTPTDQRAVDKRLTLQPKAQPPAKDNQAIQQLKTFRKTHAIDKTPKSRLELLLIRAELINRLLLQSRKFAPLAAFTAYLLTTMLYLIHSPTHAAISNLCQYVLSAPKAYQMALVMCNMAVYFDIAKEFCLATKYFESLGYLYNYRFQRFTVLGSLAAFFMFQLWPTGDVAFNSTLMGPALSLVKSVMAVAISAIGMHILSPLIDATLTAIHK